MEEQHFADDQSHYEISLTAGQAFVSFVLLLLSLAAAFAFGLMIGRGQADERLVVQKETPVVSEAAVLPKKGAGEIVELGVTADEFEEAAKKRAEAEPVVMEGATTDTIATESDADAPAAVAPTAAVEAAPDRTASERSAAAPQQPSEADVPHYAQLLSTTDQKAAEALAAKLIDGGFPTAYVQRSDNEKGLTFRVRVRFASESAARAAAAGLRKYSSEVWITTR